MPGQIRPAKAVSGAGAVVVVVERKARPVFSSLEYPAPGYNLVRPGMIVIK